ncbi:MAG: ATP-binding protein [Candidatus Heimdallarchaeaceae archaeon]
MIIKIIMFVNRVGELRAINKRLNSGDFEFIVIYGRRRIGKTALILESIKNLPHIYYLAVDGDNLRYFKRVASKVQPNISKLKDEWELLLEALKDNIIVIDEFPNLVQEESGILSLIQRLVDTELINSKTKLVFLGSSVSMMSEKVLSSRSPLYGRKTASLKLGSIRFPEIYSFFPQITLQELIEIYGFADGIPYYLKKVQPPFWDWLNNEIHSPDTFLKYEVDFLMKYEFKEVSTYKRILEAVAYGKRTPKEIRDYMGIKHSDLSPYLKNLVETEFLIREVPITERLSSKKGRYFLQDNFLSFWFRFIAPNLSSIEANVFEAEEIKNSYSAYLGTVFEKASQQFLIEINKQGKLPFKFNKFGRWWHRGEEIDLVMLNETKRKALFVETKWKNLNKADLVAIKERLIEKVEDAKVFAKYEQFFAIIAKQAQTKEVNDIIIYDLEDFKALIN